MRHVSSVRAMLSILVTSKASRDYSFSTIPPDRHLKVLFKLENRSLRLYSDVTIYTGAAELWAGSTKWCFLAEAFSAAF